VPLVSTRALILQSFPYSDTSKILRLVSPEYGLISAIAKGAQRPRSRFGGILELFTEGDAQLHLKEGRDLHPLSGFDLVRSRQALGRNLAAFAGASLLAELVLRFGTEEPNPAPFHALIRTFDRLAGAAPDEAARHALVGVWEMVALLGYEPHLDACVGCGRTPAPDEATRFDVEAGGIACTRCRPFGRVVDAQARADLAGMVRGDAGLGQPLDWGLQGALLRAFLLAHLSPAQPLRSLDLFVQQLG
jgi:DNA repair protein RecO (recombination protein O)